MGGGGLFVGGRVGGRSEIRGSGRVGWRERGAVDGTGW